MTIDDIRAALLEPRATLDSLAAAAEAARALAAATADDIAQLVGRRPDVLLNGTDKDLAKLDEAIAGANRTAERAAALAEACATRAAELQAAEAERARRERYAAAASASAELAKTMPGKYRRLVAIARELLTDIGTARSLVDAANRDLPEGCAALDNPEAFRAPLRKDRIVQEKILSAWCHEDGTPLPLERQADIADYGRPGRGRLRPGAGGKQSEEEFHREDVVRLVVQPGRGAFRFQSFDVALAIPPLVIDGPPGWRQDERFPKRILDRLRELEAHEPPADPATVEHLIPAAKLEAFKRANQLA